MHYNERCLFGATLDNVVRTVRVENCGLVNTMVIDSGGKPIAMTGFPMAIRCDSVQVQAGTTWATQPG